MFFLKYLENDKQFYKESLSFLNQYEKLYMLEFFLNFQIKFLKPSHFSKGIISFGFFSNINTRLICLKYGK